MANVDLPKLLRDRGMSLTDLARSMNVDKATATRWAQRHIPPERLQEVSRITGIPVRDLRPDLAGIFASEGDSSADAGEAA
jgi:transcriptional regulator with XRE-family HTH domain